MWGKNGIIYGNATEYGLAKYKGRGNNKKNKTICSRIEEKHKNPSCTQKTNNSQVANERAGGNKRVSMNPLIIKKHHNNLEPKQPKLNDTYGEGPRVDETALFAMALPLLSKRS
jgi:hypothetical protein